MPCALELMGAGVALTLIGASLPDPRKALAQLDPMPLLHLH
jgi:hypothetical protein